MYVLWLLLLFLFLGPGSECTVLGILIHAWVRIALSLAQRLNVYGICRALLGCMPGTVQ